MQTCKGYCDFIETKITQLKPGVWDKENARMCAICQIYFISEEIKCPCCKTMLRTKPHSRRGKERLKNCQK